MSQPILSKAIIINELQFLYRRRRRRIRQIVKTVHIPAFIPQRAVERLDSGIVGLLSWTGISHQYAVSVGLKGDQTVGKLIAVVVWVAFSDWR